mgnify:CR=1 FL=1
MSENQMTVKVGIVSAKDGLIKVVISESKSPPLLGAKAVRVRLSQIYHLLPTRSHSPARRQASGAKNAPVEDVTVAESGVEAPLDESILKQDLAAEEAETVDSDRAKVMFAAHKPSANAEEGLPAPAASAWQSARRRLPTHYPDPVPRSMRVGRRRLERLDRGAFSGEARPGGERLPAPFCAHAGIAGTRESHVRYSC